MTPMHKTHTLGSTKNTCTPSAIFQRVNTMQCVGNDAQIHDYMLILKPVQTIIGVCFGPIIKTSGVSSVN